MAKSHRRRKIRAVCCLADRPSYIEVYENEKDRILLPVIHKKGVDLYY